MIFNPPLLLQGYLTVAGLLRGSLMTKMEQITVFMANAIAVMVTQTVMSFRSILIPIIINPGPLSRGYLTVAGLLHGILMVKMGWLTVFTVNAMAVMVIQTELNFRSTPMSIIINLAPLSRGYLTVAGLLRGSPLVRITQLPNLKVFMANAIAIMVTQMVLNFRSIPTLVILKYTPLLRAYLTVAGLLHGSPICRKSTFRSRT